MVAATKEQIAIGKRLRQLRNKSKCGMTFKGSKGVGKTLMVGVMNMKPSKGTKARPAHRHSPLHRLSPSWSRRQSLNLYIAPQTAYAEKHAEQVGVARGDKPLTLARMGMLKRLGESNSVTFALTPASGGNLLSPGSKLQDALIAAAKKQKVDVVHFVVDEGHKAIKGRDSKPARVEAFRKALAAVRIKLHVTSVTATPLWDVKGKDQSRLATRACTITPHFLKKGRVNTPGVEFSLEQWIR